MKYTLKKVNIDVEKGEQPVFPPLNERTIEMRGQVVELTLSGLEATQQKRLKTIKEMEAKAAFEKAKMENIESFHPFVKELSLMDLHTAWMYFESKALVEKCTEEAEKTQGYFDMDKKEIDEIIKQIPELSETAQQVQEMLNKKPIEKPNE